MIGELLSSGPGPELQWFPEDVELGRLAETFAGMANTNGGTVLIGVAPRSGRVIGLGEPEKMMDRVFQAALLADPPLVLPLPILETHGGERLLRVVIPDGLPHVYTIGGRYLGREGRHNTPISPGSLRRKLIERGVVHVESNLVPGAGPAALDPVGIDDYAQKVGLRQDEDPETLLLRRGCLVETGDGRLPTLAGLLLFGKSPQQWAPNAFIMAARFSGPALSDAFIKREIGGTLPDQLRSAENFVADQLSANVQVTGLVHEERPEYPSEAIRELLVNAVAHRDYSLPGDSIHIHIFSNRLEIHSPGLLPGPVTMDNLLEARFSRNPVIVQVLADMGFIERLGYGLDRVMAVLGENRMQPAHFQETAGTFRVTLSKGFRTGPPHQDDRTALRAGLNRIGLNARQKAAVEHILENDRISSSEYQSLCPEVHPETLRRDMADLARKEILLKIGSKRGTYYILK
ncbi:MAG TPA: ATP-binding protein [Anaerolineales bacterium]|nr:ATP-binding protein [Anaerolineales bacterium]